MRVEFNGPEHVSLTDRRQLQVAPTPEGGEDGRLQRRAGTLQRMPAETYPDLSRWLEAMAMDGAFNNPIFQHAEKAREWLEGELWPDGAVCPHCGGMGCSTKLGGKTARPGLYMCKVCRKQFTVTVGTLFERTHIPLNKWLMAAYTLICSKNGASTHQLHRMLGISQNSAGFMMHRIREALREATVPDALST